MADAQVLVVLGAVLDADGRLLVIRRAVAEGSLVWALPGGKREPGESEAEAVRREILEETGVEVVAEERLGDRVHPVTGAALACWRCTPVGGAARVREPDKVDRVDWVEPAAFLARVPRDVFAPLRQLLETVQSNRRTRPWP